MKLIRIDRTGSLEQLAGPLPPIVEEVRAATLELYERVGYEEPWTCYWAVREGTPVGTCGFTGPAADGRVEIAYFAFPDHEGGGLATEMARELVAIARAERPGLTVTAQTLPERNASHRVLEKLGFEARGTVRHPEDGEVLEWSLAPPPGEPS